MTVCYVAGRMSNEPQFGFPLFDACAEKLREYGWTVFNPAQMDREAGLDPSLEVPPEGFVEQAFRRDMIAIGKSDAIVLLENWIRSPGARHEAQTSIWCGHDFYLYDEKADEVNPITVEEVKAQLAIPIPKPKPLLIAFGHAAQVGKDSAANILVERYGFKKLAFADTLRKIAYNSSVDVRIKVDTVGWEEAKVIYPDVRQYLVDLGVSIRDQLGEDTLVDAVFDQMVEGESYAISDTRYPNEADKILDRGGFLVKIEREGFEPRFDAADQALIDFVGWDATVKNNGTIDELAAVLDDLVADYRILA